MKGKGVGFAITRDTKAEPGTLEVMEVDDEIRELVLVGASATELKKKRSNEDRLR